MTVARPAEVRFFEKVKQEGDCWVWTGCTTDGYGAFGAGGRGNQISAHRWAYRYLIGDVPEGLYLDHLCRNPPCVNPYHLDPVTNSVNVLRQWQHMKPRTHCKRGHEFTAKNTRVDHQGYRQCRACTTVRRRESKARVRDRAKAK